MPYYIKSQIEWLEKHGELGPDEKWYCKETKKPIVEGITGRSIWEQGLSGGFGDVRRIVHLNCSGCYPDATLPTYGKPINEDELVKK